MAAAERRLSALVAVASLAISVLFVGACTVEPAPQPIARPVDDGSDALPGFPTTGQSAANATIVTGQTLTSDPGQGAGLFVTYLGGGVWRVTTTCDTTVTGFTCEYAYTLRSPTGTVAEPALDVNDGSMQLVRYAEGYDVGYIASTAIDGLTVQVDPPGAPLEVAVWLDGEPDARLLYWVAPQGVQQGASTNPTSFVPTKP